MQKKMHFLLTTLKVVYVLSTLIPEMMENEALEVTRHRGKWKNDDYICRSHILNSMCDSFFDIYQNVKSSKELWDSLESKHMAEDASSKKFLVSNFNNYKMVDSRPVMEQYNELLRILGQYAQHDMKMDESISVSSIIDKLPPSWKDFKHMLKHKKEELSLVQLGSHLCIEESLRAQETEKPKDKAVSIPSINMVKEGKFNEVKKGPNKKVKLTCWTCGMTGHLKRDCRVDKNKNGASSSDGGKSPRIKIHGKEDDVAWWIDSGATSHVCKDRRWFKSLEPVEDGFVLHMGNESTAPILGRGLVRLEFSSSKIIEPLNNLVSGGILNKLGYKQVFESDKFILSKSGSFVGFGYFLNDVFMLNLNYNNFVHSDFAFVLSSNTVDSVLWHARLSHVNFKSIKEMSKEALIPSFDMISEKCKTCMSEKSLGNLFLMQYKYIVTFIDDASRFCYVYLLHTKDEALGRFKVYKTEVELQMSSFIKCLRTDRGIIHETTTPYTPQQNGVVERKNRVLKEMVNSMLCYSGLSDGFWGEAMLTACYLLNRVPNKRNKITSYELWFKKRPNLDYIRVWDCRAVVRLPEPKRQASGEKAIHTVIESRDALFDESRFSSIPRPKDIVPSSSGTTVIEEQEIVPIGTRMLRRSKIGRIEKSFGPDYQLYLVEGSRDEIGSQFPYCYSIEEYPKSFDDAMKSQDVAFWKETINDEMDSIIGKNTWVLLDLPPGCKPSGSK
ncbi:hypothetical protein OSB04_017050 [Centaurea solstitialis]|uniref:Zinc finger, CCHC-type n=1 Tax=Centaurea solstitialis TaxID=347529 RepID=A0AA38T265_9ASTR|nr:hypothetical protein OSB04_017050 [Centaurea solstitialis]